MSDGDTGGCENDVFGVDVDRGVNFFVGGMLKFLIFLVCSHSPSIITNSIVYIRMSNRNSKVRTKRGSRRRGVVCRKRTRYQRGVKGRRCLRRGKGLSTVRRSGGVPGGKGNKRKGDYGIPYTPDPDNYKGLQHIFNYEMNTITPEGFTDIINDTPVLASALASYGWTPYRYNSKEVVIDIGNAYFKICKSNISEFKRVREPVQILKDVKHFGTVQIVREFEDIFRHVRCYGEFELRDKMSNPVYNDDTTSTCNCIITYEQSKRSLMPLKDALSNLWNPDLLYISLQLITKMERYNKAGYFPRGIKLENLFIRNRDNPCTLYIGYRGDEAARNEFANTPKPTAPTRLSQTPQQERLADAMNGGVDLGEVTASPGSFQESGVVQRAISGLTRNDNAAQAGSGTNMEEETNSREESPARCAQAQAQTLIGNGPGAGDPPSTATSPSTSPATDDHDDEADDADACTVDNNAWGVAMCIIEIVSKGIITVSRRSDLKKTIAKAKVFLRRTDEGGDIGSLLETLPSLWENGLSDAVEKLLQTPIADKYLYPDDYYHQLDFSFRIDQAHQNIASFQWCRFVLNHIYLRLLEKDALFTRLQQVENALREKGIDVKAGKGRSA